MVERERRHEVREHTISTWEVIPDAEGREGTLWIQDADGILIAEVYGDIRSIEILLKHANLIAAAPTLLAACEAASRAMANEIGMESEHRQCVAATMAAKGG